MEEIDSELDCGYGMSDSINQGDLLQTKIRDLELINHCKHCDKQFESSYKKRYHNWIRKFICNTCGELLESQLGKRRHEQKYHDDQRRHVCGVCNEVFSHKYNHDQHYKSEHSDLIKKFSCSKCPKEFKFGSRLKFHFKQAHKSSDAHICQDCGFHCENSRKLKHHMIHKHSGINSKKSCLIRNELVPVHSLRQHSDEQREQSKRIPVECEECGEPFATQTMLDKHEQNHHFKCVTCLLEFDSKFTYKKHRILFHGRNEEIFSCSDCPKVFISQSELKRHKVTHSVFRLIPCGLCEFEAKTQQTMNQHKMTKHSYVRLSECSTCSRTFKRSCDLIRHQKIHAARKFYHHCKVCNRKFEYLASMVKHEKRKHAKL